MIVRDQAKFGGSRAVRAARSSDRQFPVPGLVTKARKVSKDLETFTAIRDQVQGSWSYQSGQDSRAIKATIVQVTRSIDGLWTKTTSPNENLTSFNRYIRIFR